jgi:hypothetical protein
MKASMTRRILGNLSVVNISLAAVLILFAGHAVSPLMIRSVKLKLPSPQAQKTPPAAAADKQTEVKSPSPADYFIIAEQNIFHPERKIPVEKAVAAPLPTPEFVLYGTLMVDDLHIAYMQDKKAPQNTPTRGMKQISLRLGESLSGFVLKEIDTDKVVMVRGEEKLVVNLNDAAKSKIRETAGQPAAQPGAPGHAGPPGTKSAAPAKNAPNRQGALSALEALRRNSNQSAQQSLPPPRISPRRFRRAIPSGGQ